MHGGDVKLEEVAVAFETDWEWWNFAIAGVAVAAAVLWAVLGPRLAARAGGGLLWVVVTIPAAGVLLIVPGAVMRRMPQQLFVGWIVLGCIAAAVALVLYAWSLEHGVELVAWICAGAVAMGGIGGAISDGLNRLAASIPTTVGGAVGLLLVVGVLVYAYLQDQNN
jgi:hypothetical protein